ncbi:DUF3021 family protein [Clostridiaceae bacterium M8S5]|nr:DUF3021 family protein [Clostridiaceae bacterium M8S5]
MKYKNYIKRFINNYCITFAIIVMFITILRQIFAPNEYFELKEVFIYMTCAFISCLPGLIFYSPKEISEKQMKVRRVIHFVLLEIVLLVFGNILNILTSKIMTFLLALQIAIIYIVVRFLSWTEDKKDAHSINEKLKVMKNQ